MAFYRKKNCARTRINQTCGINASVTIVTVTDASELPDSGDFLVTIWDKTSYPDPCDDVNAEIVKVTGVSGNILTIVRGQEDTIGVSHDHGHAVEMLITAGTFEEIEDAITTGISVPIIGENLSLQANGVNITFTLANTYVANTTSLYINGQRMTRGEDYTEETSDTIEIPIVVNSGEKVVIDYYIS